MKIGKCIAEQIADGATIQLGIGNLPNAVALHLADRKDLGIHSGVVQPGLDAVGA